MKKYTVSMATVNVILPDGGIHTKLINISTVTYPRLLNMFSFQSLDITLFSVVSNAIYLISIFINFHENLKNGRKIFLKSINELISGLNCLSDTFY